MFTSYFVPINRRWFVGWPLISVDEVSIPQACCSCSGWPWPSPGRYPWHRTCCGLITRYAWWRHRMETFSALLALWAGIHQSPVNSPHKCQWLGALMFSFICTWINDWVNTREAGDLRRHRAHYDVNVMWRYELINHIRDFQKKIIKGHGVWGLRQVRVSWTFPRPHSIWQQWYCHSPRRNTAYHQDSRKWLRHAMFHYRHNSVIDGPRFIFTPEANIFGSSISRLVMPLHVLWTQDGVPSETTTKDSTIQIFQESQWNTAAIILICISCFIWVIFKQYHFITISNSEKLSSWWFDIDHNKIYDFLMLFYFTRSKRKIWLHSCCSVHITAWWYYSFCWRWCRILQPLKRISFS